MPTNLPPKGNTIETNRLHESDTGSPEVQIALLSDRVPDQLTDLAPGAPRRLVLTGAARRSA